VHQTQQPPVGVPWHQATFAASFSRFWRGYLVFRGRAARAEFWWWALWWAILSAAINIVYGIGLFTTPPPMPSPDEARVIDQAMQSFNPFPVWWFLLTSMPVFAKVALGVFAAALDRHRGAAAPRHEPFRVVGPALPRARRQHRARRVPRTALGATRGTAAVRATRR
jgi:hypothetical protein